MDYQKRLYQILYPNSALIASQLTPQELAQHYQVGSSKYFDSKIIFAEIDANYRHDYFMIDETFKELIPHEDGRPKSTKFVCSYRTLEHIDLSAFKNLYLCTSNGNVLELKKEKYDFQHMPGFIRTFVNINPLDMLVFSKLNAPEFGQFLSSSRSKGAPTCFYSQIEFNTEKFLKDLEDDPFHGSPFPFVHRSKLRDGIIELTTDPNKENKGLSLNSDFSKISYKQIRHGYWFATKNKSIFYPMPTAQEIEKNHFAFFKDM